MLTIYPSIWSVVPVPVLSYKPVSERSVLNLPGQGKQQNISEHL